MSTKTFKEKRVKLSKDLLGFTEIADTRGP